jgi:hypothetical protein
MGLPSGPGPAEACYLVLVGRLCEWREIGIWQPAISGSWRLLVGVLDARHPMDKDMGLYICLVPAVCVYWFQCCSAEKGKGWQYVLELWVHSRGAHLVASLVHFLQLFPMPCLNLHQRLRFNIIHVPLTSFLSGFELGICHLISPPRSHNQTSSTVLDGRIGKKTFESAIDCVLILAAASRCLDLYILSLFV